MPNPRLARRRCGMFTETKSALRLFRRHHSPDQIGQGEIIVNRKTILIAAALALAGGAGAADAQSGNWNRSQNYNTGIWQGAPDGLQQRIDWLQQRIDRGVADGSLNRRETRDAQAQLNQLRSEADALNQRLDDLSRRIRWSRGNGGYGNNYGNNYNNGYNNNYNSGARDPYAIDYDASRYYRDEPQYQEHTLGVNDAIYRGSDGRYYCQRSDGTIGLVVGGVGGAAVGNVIDGGHNRVAGTLIGGALGALLGQTVDRSSSDVRCH
jgi:hypothetical protein